MKKEKLNNLAVAAIICVVCICLISVMFMQFKTIEETDITDIENMREAELRQTLAEWKSKYEETAATLEDTNKKIAEYKEAIDKDVKASKLIDEELEQSNLAVGKTNVTGEGVVVTLDDGEYEDIIAGDLIYLINELKYAGAEAISINDIRIINTTYIVDLGGFSYILVGDQRLEAPYVVKAIGNQDYLTSILNMKDSGFIDLYKNDDKKVKMETSSKIQIPRYNGEMTYKNMQIKEEEK